MKRASVDEELVRRAQQGDADAFGQIYERYVDDVYRFFYYRTLQTADAEDLTEATFLKAWQGLKRLRVGPELNLRAWLLRIARNLWIDRHRTAKEEAPLEAAATVAASEPNPEAALLEAERGDELAAALAQLPERLRDVIVYRFVHGLSHKETAALLGVNEGHVRVLQHRALQRLRRWLEAQAQED
ncbi:MAG: RNA polymerase sigma factor [Chloroflexi bacterium]|nr:RNA polymerase sigma factor [Chloroflexota bacterium]